MEDKRNTAGAEAQTRRPARERLAAKVDVLSSYELRLSPSFLSRRLDSLAAEKQRAKLAFGREATTP